MLLIHTPKCGGSFIVKAFSPYIKSCPSLTVPRLSGHLTYIEYREGLRLLARDICDFWTVSLVRNPFDWHTSWYTYICCNSGKHTGYHVEHELFQKMDFDDYVEWLDDCDAPRSPQFAMGKLLLEWSCDETRKIRTNHVLRQETLRRDVEALKTKLGLRIRIPDKPLNISKSDDYRKFYSDKSAERIAKRHAEDCRLFGYDFDGAI